MSVQIEMCEKTNTKRFWAWSNKDYPNVIDFVQEYNTQAEKFGTEKIDERNQILLEIGSPVVVDKWIFKPTGN